MNCSWTLLYADPSGFDDAVLTRSGDVNAPAARGFSM